MTLAQNIIRSETLYVSKATKRRLHTLALIQSAQNGGDAPQVDSLGDDILTAYLDAVPMLAEREKEIRDAVKSIDAKYAERAKPCP